MLSLIEPRMADDDCSDCKKHIADGDDCYLLVLPPKRRKEVINRTPMPPESVTLCQDCGDALYRLVNSQPNPH